MHPKLHVRITRAGRGNPPAETLTGAPRSDSYIHQHRPRVTGICGALRVHVELKEYRAVLLSVLGCRVVDSIIANTCNINS